MRRREIPTLERLEDVLFYDAESGALRWNVRRSGTAKRGDIAGTFDHATGATAITLDGRRYQAHHLVWYMHRRVWPVHQLLFRDKDPTNLSITNLYSVEEVYSENPKAIYARARRERKARRRTNQLEYQRRNQAETIETIVFNETHQKWRVMDPTNSRRTIKQFDTPDEARAFAAERERILNRLEALNKTFTLKPTDDFLLAGTEPGTETYAEIADLIIYDPDNGQFYYRKADASTGELRADFTSASGRQVVTIFSRYFSVAMLAWFLTHRQWPKPKQIGWRNGDNKDNRLSNLMNLKAQR